MRLHGSLVLGLGVLLASGGCHAGGQGEREARAYVSVVGSSTVYPFASAVAQDFVRITGARLPVVESTGTGAGIALFCQGDSLAFPDIVDASRRMTPAEYARCKSNGVEPIMEIQVGIDGLVFAEARNGPRLKLTPADIYKALAANPYGSPNRARTWREVNAALPDIPILVYGPPSTSGTRDALEEMILEAGCLVDPKMKALHDKDLHAFAGLCHFVRRDGPYVDAAENDNLIVEKLAENPQAIGVFGYSYLEENRDRLRGVPLSGVAPRRATIADFSYPGARPLYIYVKKANLARVKGLSGYVTAWSKSWGPDGVLARRGMVVAPPEVRARGAAIIAGGRGLDPAELAGREAAEEPRGR